MSSLGIFLGCRAAFGQVPALADMGQGLGLGCRLLVPDPIQAWRLALTVEAKWLVTAVTLGVFALVIGSASLGQIPLPAPSPQAARDVSLAAEALLAIR
jgi:hypothetical protein